MTLTVGILQGGANSHETSSEEANAIATDFVTEGVVGAITNTSGVAPATGGFAVNAQGTPDMTVAVSAGTAYVTGTPTSGNSQTVRVKNSATANVTITANSTGGTRYDWIYIKLDPDTLKDPAADASDVATLVASRSTSASTDNGTPPTYGYCLAVVTVSNGASSITNGNITDSRISTGATPADDSVTAAKLLNGLVYRRQGGNTSNWYTAGTTNYDVSASDVKIQVGTIAINADPTTVTFPVAFTNPPVVVAMQTVVSGANCFIRSSNITATTVSLSAITDSGAANTSQSACWIAIGI